MADAPLVQLLRHQRRVGQVLGRRPDGILHRVPMALLALFDRLDDVEAQGHPGLLDPVDLRRDERLGYPRVPHQDVGDGPGHNPLTPVTSATSRGLEEPFNFA